MEEGERRRREREGWRRMRGRGNEDVIGHELQANPQTAADHTPETIRALGVKHCIVQERARVKHYIVQERTRVKHYIVQERARVKQHCTGACTCET